MNIKQRIALLDMQEALEWMKMNNCEAERDVKYSDGWRCDYAGAQLVIHKTYEEAKKRAEDAENGCAQCGGPKPKGEIRCEACENSD